jgi:hypothetical protein
LATVENFQFTGHRGGGVPEGNKVKVPRLGEEMGGGGGGGQIWAFTSYPRYKRSGRF